MDQRTGRLSDPYEDDAAMAAGEAEIQQTREEISETLDAIEEKLNPERLTDDAKDAAKDTVDHVVAEAKDAVQEWSEIASVAAMEAVDHAMAKVREALPDLTDQAQSAASDAVDHAIEEAKAAVRELGEQARAAVRDATIGRVERMAHTTGETSKYVGSTVVERIKQNPGPAALTALGIGWLFMSGKDTQSQYQGQGHPGYATQSSGYQGSTGLGERMQSTAGSAQETAGNLAGQVQEGVGTAADQVQQTASQVAEQAQSMVTGAAGQVQETAGQLTHRAQETAGQLTHRAQEAPQKTRRMIENNPLGMGLVALALGGAAALAIPETRKENELMGEARDALVHEAQSKGAQAFEKAQDVVEGMQKTVEGVEEAVEQVGDSKSSRG